MPEAYTHIRIARMAQKILQDSIGPAENTGAYEMGANGPDPLFAHHVCSRQRPLEALGQALHTQRCGRFLRAMIFRAYTPAQRSYTQGFLTHYAADTTLHPYVQAQAAEGGLFAGKEGHGFCESAMDTYFYEKDGLPLPMDGAVKAPALAPEDLAQITALLKACIAEVYGVSVTQEDLADSFHDFRWLHTRVLTIPKTQHAKRAGLTLAEYLILRRPGFVRSHITPAKIPLQGLPSEWSDPVTGQSRSDGPDALCEAAAKEAAHMIKMTFAYWRGLAAPEQLAVALGDKNYLTGALSAQEEPEESLPAQQEKDWKEAGEASAQMPSEPVQQPQEAKETSAQEAAEQKAQEPALQPELSADGKGVSPEVQSVQEDETHRLT